MTREARQESGEPLDPNSPEFLERLKHLYRYAQLGRCVNGVTHELNNHLGAVMAYAELVSLDKNLGPQSQRMLHEIIEGAKRANHLLSVFTGVARKEKNNENAVEIGTLLGHVADLQSYNVKSVRARLEVRCAENLPSFLGDAPKLEMALNYLVMNAIQAMDGTLSGVITVSAAHEDESITVCVNNSGPPVQPQCQERIFYPFITGCDGPHLGLGLSLARDIFALHGGSLEYVAGRGFVGRIPVDRVKPD